MSFPALLSPWSLFWALAAVAIFALYLLKPRSRRHEVSSIWLWQGVLREESARSPVQWLKRHALLLMQLALALTAAFLLSRPASDRRTPIANQVVIAIDASEAMLANDGDPTIAGRGGASTTRLDEAKGRALQALSQLRPGDRATVMAMADRTEIAASGAIPGDAAALRAGILRIQPRPTELDAAHAIQVAGSLVTDARIGEVLLITGGVLDPDRVTYRPPVAISVVRVGRGDSDNQAVTALSARKDRHGDLEVFARVRNFGSAPASGPLRFYVDGELYHELPITIPANNSWESVLTEFPPGARIVQAQFGRGDLLALDNVATTAVATAPSRKVLLVGKRSDQLERALKAVPGVELTLGAAQDYSPTTPYDVYVFEGWFPPSPPPGHWFLIDPPARGSPIAVTGTLGRRTDGGREINDANVARIAPSPLLSGVDLTGVIVNEAKKLRLPDWAEAAVWAREAPLMFTGFPNTTDRPHRAVVLAFDPRSTNLFGRVGFPILIANAVNWLTGETSGAARVGPFADTEIVPGDALLIQPLPRATRVEIQTPMPRGRRVDFEGNLPVRFLDTSRPGAYVVTQYAGDAEIARRTYVAAVLQPGREAALADLKPREQVPNLATITGARTQDVLLGPGFQLGRIEWWRPLALLALVGLVAEWWWYHR
ncbi:MAG TPA: BatA and WFA domain-containing protein [Chloroflexota bacterium]|nr:BatA and WFA domain-containing protein [Chloroflexota bacterium]